MVISQLFHTFECAAEEPVENGGPPSKRAKAPASDQVEGRNVILKISHQCDLESGCMTMQGYKEDAQTIDRYFSSCRN